MFQKSSSVCLNGIPFDIGTDVGIGIIVEAAVYFLLEFQDVGIRKQYTSR